MMDGALRILIEPVVQYEGTVARLMGDGLMAFLGTPAAHEDDPERACRVALEIATAAQSYAQELEDQHQVDLHHTPKRECERVRQQHAREVVSAPERNTLELSIDSSPFRLPHRLAPHKYHS